MSLSLSPIFSTNTAAEILIRIAEELPATDEAGRLRLFALQAATLKYFDVAREFIADAPTKTPANLNPIPEVDPVLTPIVQPEPVVAHDPVRVAVQEPNLQGNQNLNSIFTVKYDYDSAVARIVAGLPLLCKPKKARDEFNRRVEAECVTMYEFFINPEVSAGFSAIDRARIERRTFGYRGTLRHLARKKLGMS